MRRERERDGESTTQYISIESLSGGNMIGDIELRDQISLRISLDLRGNCQLGLHEMVKVLQSTPQSEKSEPLIKKKNFIESDGKRSILYCT